MVDVDRWWVSFFIEGMFDAQKAQCFRKGANRRLT